MKKELPKAWTMPRPVEEIQKQYADLCMMAGDKQYRGDLLKAELMEINKKLFELNQEHSAALQMKTDTPDPTPVVEGTVNEATA